MVDRVRAHPSVLITLLTPWNGEWRPPTNLFTVDYSSLELEELNKPRPFLPCYLKVHVVQRRSGYSPLWHKLIADACSRSFETLLLLLLSQLPPVPMASAMYSVLLGVIINNAGWCTVTLIHFCHQRALSNNEASLGVGLNISDILQRN